ncbi:enoyl-CoA hydratase-related protein [Microbacterium sp. H1-D42]|uniref:enoyl-CoA hydratase-related protein n=1 Tax=Microbacterium sp. H1-D42 TaxID=2925844 RepID=UPI001F5315E7|nr:enoyl-CoA hydratase-related protein [Microbacterium sp. H1-D42]UNK71300.1 enoyl-CoA hydratase-related protein [Microbacterium sp. H1-D42]
MPEENVAEYETILVEQRGRVGWITLNRPEALNALNRQVAVEVAGAAEAFDADDGIGAIVVTGSEKAFAAGADIKEMESKTASEMLETDHFGAWTRFAAVRTPVIAAVSGYALGGGCEVAMMCDIILAADSARFGQPEINLGVIPGMGGTQRLIRAVGYYKAAELILSGRMIAADEAERIGLVSRVVPASDLLDEAGKLAETIASKSLPSLYAAKATLDAAMETSLADGVLVEKQQFAALFDTADQKEGMAAFREKRPPHFHHR